MIAKLRGHSPNLSLPDCYLAERISIELATSTIAGSRLELERKLFGRLKESTSGLVRRDMHIHFTTVEK